MNIRVIDQVKSDVALSPQALNNTNVTGKFFQLTEQSDLSFILLASTMAAATTMKLEIVQAKDTDGTDVKDLTGSDKTLTANTKVTEATIALATVANNDVVTILADGVTTSFTKAAATSVANKEFADAAGLVLNINNYYAGVLKASAVTTTVTVAVVDGKADITVTKTENAGTITLATTEAQITVSAKPEDIDKANGFTSIAPKVTCTSNSVVAVVIERNYLSYGRDIVGEHLEV